MNDADAKQATPHDELIRQLLDSRVPKTDREHAAAREIEKLRKGRRALLDEEGRKIAGRFIGGAFMGLGYLTFVVGITTVLIRCAKA